MIMRLHATTVWTFALGLALGLGAGARAQSPRSATDAGDASAAPSPAAPEPPPAPAPNPFVLSGYVEAFYQWNFNDPSNGITNYRGFDNRHNSFTLSNLALGARWDYKDLIGRVTLQVGHTPSTYYLSEPVSPGASGANASNAELWKYVQQAYAGYRFGLGQGLIVAAGIFLSPIGPESMAVYDSWNWSRSNLFFGLPFYHTGARATYLVSDNWSVTLAAYNGWNSVVDNNDAKSLAAQVTYARDRIALSLLYFGGVERPRGAPEGRHWRHLFDAHLTWSATSWLSIIAHGNGGFEPTDFGVSAWGAGALYGRFRLLEVLHLALRADLFCERVAEDAAGRAAPLFWPAPWVTSATATLDFRPYERVSFRLEYRHDQAGDDMFFGGRVAAEDDAPPAPNRVAQNTLTAGLTSWF